MEGRCCNNMFKDCVGFLEEESERRDGTDAGGFGCAMRSAEYIGGGRGGGEKRKGCYFFVLKQERLLFGRRSSVILCGMIIIIDK